MVRNNKPGSGVKDLGCSLDYLVEFLEKKFYKNKDTNEMMSWDNYGEWHIDHIKPLSKFNLQDREQFLEAVHYKNLQPLWSKENISKGAKLNWENK